MSTSCSSRRWCTARAAQSRLADALNARLLRECRQLRAEDAAGRRWSARHYPGGYTSYGSAHRMQQSRRPSPRSRASSTPRRALRARTAVRARRTLLAMTDCWVNIMGRAPLTACTCIRSRPSAATTTLRCPRPRPGLKLEDPRLERFMAAPPRRARCSRRNRPWMTSARAPGSWCCSRVGCATRCSPTAPRASASASVSTTTGSSWPRPPRRIHGVNARWQRALQR